MKHILLAPLAVVLLAIGVVAFTVGLVVHAVCIGYQGSLDFLEWWVR